MMTFYSPFAGQFLGILSFTGHLHPVLVHLPLGILVIGVFTFFIARKAAYEKYRPAVPLLFLAGALTALLSCITGYIQSVNAAYDADVKNAHMWMGIATAFVALLVFSRSMKPVWDKQMTALVLLLGALLTVTGHLGGTLTHGPDYLSLSSHRDSAKKVFPAPIPHVEAAQVYGDLIHPIFEARCVSCHGQQRQKGKLRLDEPEAIMKGGKSGKAIVIGKPESGELIRRLMLGTGNKEHMPPIDEPQLEPREIALLKWWLGDSADFHKVVASMPVVPGMKQILQQLSAGTASAAAEPPPVPESPVTAATPETLKLLRSRGIQVQPVSLNSSYLSVVFYTTAANDSSLSLLDKIRDQLIWLNLGSSNLNDSGLRYVGRLQKLTKLYLNDTKISDAGMNGLKPLTQLQYLNLVNTGISLQGLNALAGNKMLNKLFLYKSSVAAADRSKVHALFPHAIVDSGGYRVNTLAGDTTVK